MAEFNRVKQQFMLKNGRISSNWYSMRIAELAKLLSWDGAYRIWYAMCCNFAHADPFSTHHAIPPGPGQARVLMMACLHYYARMLSRLADKCAIVLTSQQHEFLQHFSKPLE